MAKPSINEYTIRELERIKYIKQKKDIATAKCDYKAMKEAKEELDKYTKMFESIPSKKNAYVCWYYYVCGYDTDYIAKCFNQTPNSIAQRKKYAIKYISDNNLIDKFIYNDLPPMKEDLINNLGKIKEEKGK